MADICLDFIDVRAREYILVSVQQYNGPIVSPYICGKILAENFAHIASLFTGASICVSLRLDDVDC